jgi:hypothetical protein
MTHAVSRPTSNRPAESPATRRSRLPGGTLAGGARTWQAGEVCTGPWNTASGRNLSCARAGIWRRQKDAPHRKTGLSAACSGGGCPCSRCQAYPSPQGPPPHACGPISRASAGKPDHDRDPGLPCPGTAAAGRESLSARRRRRRSPVRPPVEPCRGMIAVPMRVGDGCSPIAPRPCRFSPAESSARQATDREHKAPGATPTFDGDSIWTGAGWVNRNCLFEVRSPCRSPQSSYPLLRDQRRP